MAARFLARQHGTVRVILYGCTFFGATAWDCAGVGVAFARERLLASGPSGRVHGTELACMPLFARV
jgi:hypothetical protein